MILRLFISLVPEFSTAAHRRANENNGSTQLAPESPTVSPEVASAIREYISMDVLKACITSFHEPYFVEVQKELASLIASIFVNYGSVTATPKNILLSLPNVNPAVLERLAVYMTKPQAHTRQQRAIVMDLLKDLKGVSISEMHKLPQSTSFGRSKKSARSKMAQEFMNADTAPAPPGRSGGRGTTPDGLEGVSNLFEG
jgi:exportin-5